VGRKEGSFLLTGVVGQQPSLFGLCLLLLLLLSLLLLLFLSFAPYAPQG